MSRHEEKAREVCERWWGKGPLSAPAAEMRRDIATALRDTERETIEMCAGVLMKRAVEHREERRKEVTYSERLASITAETEARECIDVVQRLLSRGGDR